MNRAQHKEYRGIRSVHRHGEILSSLPRLGVYPAWRPSPRDIVARLFPPTYRRRGVGSLPIVLAAVAVAALVGVVVWYSFQQVRAGDSEEMLDIPMICASCGHTFSASFDGLAELTARAHEAGHTSAGRDMKSAVGLCPGCGRYTVYRAEEDAQTGKLVPPSFATTATKRAVVPAPATTHHREAQGERP